VSCVYILVCKRKIFLTILMPSVIYRHFRHLVGNKNIVRNANKRFGFSSTHCGKAFKDYNVVSYNRMSNQCKKWRGPINMKSTLRGCQFGVAMYCCKVRERHDSEGQCSSTPSTSNTQDTQKEIQRCI
jgi:hypothetical protein